MPTIVVAENIHGPSMDRLKQTHDVLFDPDLWKSVESLHQSLGNARALIVRNNTRVTADLLDRAPHLEVIARAGAGLDNIDTSAASRLGIVVTFTPSENSVSVAELVLGMMLSLVRNLPAGFADTRNGGWDRVTFTGGELSGRTLGIVGFGRIGRLVAERARAFGMRLLVTDEFIPVDAPILSDFDAKHVPLDSLMSKADIVSVHIPLTETTRGLFDARQFALMKPTALFINASRGEVVNESDLARSLQTRQFAGAGLDVRSQEPPVTGVLESLPNVLLTPHIGAFTHEAQDRVVDSVCRDVTLILDGQPAVGFFNFPRPARTTSGSTHEE